MNDGRVVKFAGKRKMLKTTSTENGVASVTFDFRNGETRTFTVPADLLLQAAAHGASQKIGDSVASESDLDDAILGIDEMIARLSKGEWFAEREGSADSFSGASIVIKAIGQITGKSADAVKAFLQGKIDAAAAKGEKLTRQALYKSFRNPATEVGKLIQQLEAEKNAKASGLDANELMSELSA